MKWRVGIIITIVLVTLLGVLFWVFDRTGGRGLVNLYFNYLSQDIKDKKLGWRDFTDRGEGQLVSGYYAGNRGGRVYVWTLSGLRSYRHQEGVSVYRYADVCRMVRQLSANKFEATDQRPLLSTDTLFSLDEWLADAKVGDYVSVRWVSRDGQKYIIDKLYGSSNQHYPIEQLRLEQCQN